MVYDIGTLVKTISVTEPIGIRQIDISGLTDGIYFISTNQGGTDNTGVKFTIQH